MKAGSSPRKIGQMSPIRSPSNHAGPRNFSSLTGSVGEREGENTENSSKYSVNESPRDNSDFGSPFSIRPRTIRCLNIQRSSTSESVEQPIMRKDDLLSLCLNLEPTKGQNSLENLWKADKPTIIHEDYEQFVKKNLFNFSIIKKYCEEITNQPFDTMLATDSTVGKWLDEEVHSLQTDLLAMGKELSRYKIDTSILDIYRNLLILVGKRYILLYQLTVVS